MDADILSQNSEGEISDFSSLNRTGAHSHIMGLGLIDGGLVPAKIASGLVGQEDARRAAGIVHRLIKDSKIAGQCILIYGKPGTGKTALAMGIAKEIGFDTPFYAISGSEIFSLDISKTEALTQVLRKSIGIRIKEETEVIEGEVVEIVIDRTYEAMGNRTGKLTLKTTDLESVYDLGNKMIEAIQREKIQAGDIIVIVKSTGKITKLGRSYSRTSDFDAIGPETNFVPCPEGELLKRKELTHTITLHEIDSINSRTHGFMALFSGETGEIKSELRDKINSRIHEWIQEGKAELVPGVLFIDEVHVLDIECFSYLNRALESVLAPVVIIATNKKNARIRGTNYISPHGIPFDFLDRTLIIKTRPYNEEEMKAILSIRCNEEEVSIDPEAIELLTKIAMDTSLRYSMQLIQTSNIIALRSQKSSITVNEIQNSYKLFVDEQRSAKRLKDMSSLFDFGKEVDEDPYSLKFINKE